MKKIILSLSAITMLLISCENDDLRIEENTSENIETPIDINSLTFNKIGSFTNGNGEGFSEISTFDPHTNKLFVVNPEENEISVLDLTNPKSPTKQSSIPLTGSPNSVDVYNGVLAIAVENINKQANGTIETYDTQNQTLLKSYQAGALPDMVKFSPDGNYIVAANEGEPNDEYTNDPKGSITIINTTLKTQKQLNFDTFSNPGNDFRVFGELQNTNSTATLAQDIEPEYVTISNDSKKAFISLQENNGMAMVNLETQTIEKIVGLGTKDFNIYKMDASDKDDTPGNFKNWNVLSFYMPDAITYFEINGIGYIASANEGDSRDYKGFSEEERVKKIKLDPTIYSNAAELQKDENLGRLKITTANGDIDEDGDYDQIYGYGGRSFSIWNVDGSLLYDSGSEIGEKTFELSPNLFNNNDGEVDKRSDDKGAEPESVTTLTIDNQVLLFVGLERTSGILVYNVTNPSNPIFLDWLYDTNDLSPEGLIVINKEDSPTGNYLLVGTYETSSTIAIYEIK